MIRVAFWILIVSFIGMVSCNEPGASDAPTTGKEADKSEQKAPRSRSDEVSIEIRKDPKNPKLYAKRADAHVEEGSLMLALEDINRALTLDSMNAVFHLSKGEILYAQKEVNEAIDSFERALELDANNTEALLKMAEVQLLLRQYQECFDLANKALRINDQLYQGYFIKGYAHYELGDTSRFVSSVQTAIELNPNFFDGFMMLGSFYSSVNDDVALDYFDSALEVRRDDVQALYAKAMFFQEQGRLEEAMELYEYMVALDPNNGLAWYNQGYVWLEHFEEPQAAIPFFKKTIEVFEGYDDAYYNLGLCYELIGNFSEARDYFEQTLEVNPQHDLAAVGLSRVTRRS